MRHRTRVWGAVAGLVAACSGPSSSGAALPPAPPVVDITLWDYRFDYRNDVPAGRVQFRVHNRGQRNHQLLIILLGEDVPPIDVQLRGSERRAAAPFAAVPLRHPGENGLFAVDLAPGERYALICFLPDDDGQPHFQKGMSSEFRAGGPTAGPRMSPGPTARS